MSDVLTVPTQFADISELADGLGDRVDENRIILYGPEACEEGSTIQFAILLEDGSPALEGAARVLTSIDGGEERPPETRYDVVLDNLELDGRAEVVFERLLMAAGGEGEGTGEVSAEAVQDVDEGAAVEETTPADEGALADEAAVEEAPPEEAAEADVAEAEEAAAEPGPDFDAEEEATMVVDPGSSEVELSETAEAGASGAEAEAFAAEEPSPEEAWGPEAEQPAGELAEEPAEAAETATEAVEGEPEEPAEAGAMEAPAEEAFQEAPTVDQADMEGAMDAAAESPEVAGDVEPGGEEGAPLDSEEALAAQVDQMDDSTPMADEEAERPAEREPPGAPVAPPAFEVERMGSNGQALTRPSLAINWEPQAMPTPEGGGGSGYFDYGVGQLPVPETPPRPEMDPSYRVGPAPQPGEEAVAAAGGAIGMAEPEAEPVPAAEEAPMEAFAETPDEEGAVPELEGEGVGEAFAEDAPAVEPEEPPEAGAAEGAEASPEAAAESAEASEPPEELEDIEDFVEMDEASEEADDADKQWD